MDWIERKKTSESSRQKTTWAAVALAAVSLLVQVTNFITVDLKPVMQGINRANEKLEKIERQLEDHERRIRKLESKKDGETDGKKEIETNE